MSLTTILLEVFIFNYKNWLEQLVCILLIEDYSILFIDLFWEILLNFEDLFYASNYNLNLKVWASETVFF